MPTASTTADNTSQQSDHFRENAENCARLAESAKNEPLHLRYKRMEAAWLALAQEQDWLDGETAKGAVAHSLMGTATLSEDDSTSVRVFFAASYTLIWSIGYSAFKTRPIFSAA